MNLEEHVQQYFRIYYRQQDAFDYQQIDPGARVFAFETPELKNGCRRFISVQPMEFFDFYKECRKGRWFYEVIQEDLPCRPYFDLEFYKDMNSNLDPIACYIDFVSICKEVFVENFKIRLDDNDFLTLDSTTEDKFSAHVIIHLPNGLLFPSNVSQKLVVDAVCKKMITSKKCLVIKGDKFEFLCDRSVYTKNRNFRLCYSSKCGKGTKFLYADYCNFYGATKFSSEDLFFDALIVPFDLQNYEVLDIGHGLSRNHGLLKQKSYVGTSNGSGYKLESQKSTNNRLPIKSIEKSKIQQSEDSLLKLEQQFSPIDKVKTKKLIPVTKSSIFTIKGLFKIIFVVFMGLLGLGFELSNDLIASLILIALLFVF